MKKDLQGKILTALIVLAVSAWFISLQAQVNVTFVNDSADAGNTATGGIDPLTLNFRIDDAGKISLNASSKNPNVDVQKVVNAWDSDSVGTTDNAALFGKRFSLVATTNKRLQCRLTGGGGLGVQGKNQWRLDDGGAEFIYFTLYGDVGVEFTSVAYNDFNDDGGNGNFRLMDFDSDETFYLDTPVLTGDTVFALSAGDWTMRYQTDTLTIGNSDTISTSTGNEGGRIYGLNFNVVEAEPMPLPAGQIAFDFMNGSDVSYGNPDGIHPVTLAFAIDGTGQISMDASTGSENQDNIAFIDTWDRDNVGMTDNAALFNKTFSLLITTNERLQCRTGGGLGVQGRNQWRIDDQGTEMVYFTLEGDVGLELAQFRFNDINELTENDTVLDLAHFRWMDYDSDETYFVDNWSGDIGFYDVPEGEIYMRYKSDMLTITTSDTIAGDAGGRLYGLVFNVLEALPKTPAVLSTTPPHADTLVAVSDDFVILFDAPMNQAVSSAAITFSPEVANRVDTWNEAGDQITISYDDLSLYTVYTVTVGEGVMGENGLNALGDTTFTFQTLPEPPTVVSTYPVQLGKQLPVNTPLAVEFSRPMNPDSVENAISFEPELAGVGFVWNDNYTMVYMISDEMDRTRYTVTISTVATDSYGLQLSDPFTFTFNTWPVSVEDINASDVVLYPNPASDLLEIRGMDVASVKFYSLRGHLVKEVHNTALINVSDMEPGSYIVTVSDRTDNRVRKMIVID